MVRPIIPRCLLRTLVVRYTRLATLWRNAVPTLPWTSVGDFVPRRPRRHYAASAIALDLDAWRTVDLGRKDNISETIYALSTAPGRAAIAVIRISGPACLDVYRRLCPNRPLPKARTATLRRLYGPDASKPLHDRVLDSGALVLYFPAPNTVTGEDVLELHVHGGPAIVRSVLEAISSCAEDGVTPTPTRIEGRHTPTQLEGRSTTTPTQIQGRCTPILTQIRPAEPGEFTKRAFYNGRLDLTQAEALGETLAAETEQQRRLAVSGTDGGLARRYEEWRTMLLYARGELEALIDFSEDQHFDESPVEFMASVAGQVQALKKEVELHIRNANKGELLRKGISIALLGAPNAGKSSLLNRIVGREAAIVSAEAGTTRDIVDVTVDLDGWLCRLGDMAGLRGDGSSTTTGGGAVGLVEQEGIRRARERALQSEVVVALLAVEKRGDDGPLDVLVNPQVLEAVEECSAAGKTILVVVNKVDLLDRGDGDGGGVGSEVLLERLRARIGQEFPMVTPDRICAISCRKAAAVGSDAPENVGSGLTDTDDVQSQRANSDPGGIQAFLALLTRAFKDLTTAATGEKEDALTPAEAQSYWAASLSVTHRQSTYLRQCLTHLDEFLDQCQPQHTDFALSSTKQHDEEQGRPSGLLAVDASVDIVTAAEHLRFAADCLVKITGKGQGGDVEDVLGVVFEK